MGKLPDFARHSLPRYNRFAMLHRDCSTESRTVGLLLAICALVASCVGACASSTPAPPSPRPTVPVTATPSPTLQASSAADLTGSEVHLWHSLSGSREATLLSLASKFEAQNSAKIRLRIEFHDPLSKEVLVALEAGTPPDIMIASADQVAECMQRDAIVPLRSYITDPAYGLSTAEQADLWPIALQATSVVSRTDQVYGILLDSQAAVMFYNASWLKRLKAPAAPQSWEEFGKVCAATRDRKAGTWGCAFLPDGPVLVNWISGLGGSLVDAERQMTTLDSAEAVTALSLLRNYEESGCLYCVSQPGTNREDFVAEKVPFTFGSTQELAVYSTAIMNAKTKKPRFEWSVAALPHLAGQPVVTVEGSLISILRTLSRQQLAAWMFLKWLLRPENDAQWALATGALPLRMSSKDLPDMQAYLKQNPQYKAACELLAYAQAEPMLPNWSQIRALLSDTATSVCSNNAEPADALAAAQSAADRLVTK